MNQNNVRLATELISKLPNSIANTLIDFFTKNVSIAVWDDKLLGLSERPIKTIIDIGANQGQAIQKFSKIFPNAIIYAFEPLEVPFKKLKNIAQTNPRIRPYNSALGDTEKTLTFFDYEKSNVSSSFLRVTPTTVKDYPIMKCQKEIQVKQLTLDAFFKESLDSLQKEILVKIDVQGYENNVIKGGAKTLEQASACIVEISIDYFYEKQTTFKEVFLLLDRLGFNYIGNIDQVKAENGRVKYFDAVFSK